MMFQKRTVVYKEGYDLRMLDQLNKFHYHHFRKMLINSVKLTHFTAPAFIYYTFHTGQALYSSAAVEKR